MTPVSLALLKAANTPDLDAFFFGGNLYGSIFENPIEGSIIQIGSNTFLGGENRNGNIILVTEGSTSGVGEATVTAQNTDFISGGIDAIIGASSTVVFRGADNTLFNSGNISDLTAFRNALADGDITFAEAIFSIRAVNGQGQEFSGRYILDDPFIQVSGVPEPSTSMALALALIGGLARRKRG